MENIDAHIQQIRKDYQRAILSEEQVDTDPIRQFSRWLREALDAKVNEPNAMTLSTVGEEGYPESRIVLLRNLSAGGFCFYTNYLSRKGRSIAQDPKVCLNFFWPELERQVRITGIAEKVPEQQSSQYFATRPRSSQIGAWASPQSEELRNRAQLEELERQMIEKFDGREVERPPHWGGYVVNPVNIEFWQGRASRLHDRILYSQQDGSWKISRLAP